MTKTVITVRFDGFETIRFTPKVYTLNDAKAWYEKSVKALIENWNEMELISVEIDGYKYDVA